MEQKNITLEMSQRDWNEWARVYYRLEGVYSTLKILTEFDDCPYWMDQILLSVQDLLISFIMRQDFPGLNYLDIDDDGCISEEMYDTYLEVSKSQAVSPLLVNDGILDEYFVTKLYENIRKAIETCIAEAME